MTRSNRVVAGAFTFLSLCGMVLSASAQIREPLQINWADAVTARTATARSTMRASGAIAADLDRTRLPVLVIDGPEMRAAPRFASQGLSYAAAYLLKGAQLSILGAATGIRVQSPRGQTPSNETGPSFETTDDGADYSFMRFGASYTLRLTCDNLADARCRKPEFLTKIANELALVNSRAPR